MKEPEQINRESSKLSRSSYYCAILNIFIIAASIFYSIYIASQSCKFTNICERPLYELLNQLDKLLFCIYKTHLSKIKAWVLEYNLVKILFGF